MWNPPAPPLALSPQALLETQLAGCARQLAVVQWEHEYIKDQLTTTEVGGGGAVWDGYLGMGR